MRCYLAIASTCEATEEPWQSVMTELRKNWLAHLIDFREQGMRVSDINPVAALADIICEQLYGGEIDRDDLDTILGQISGDLWARQRQHLRLQTGISNTSPPLPDLGDQDITQPVYRAVFTAHPVFALRHEVSMDLCSDAETDDAQMPDQPYAQRSGVTLQDEHAEAMGAICNARRAICDVNSAILQQRQAQRPKDWRTDLPQMLGVSTWVSYDLDGRSDISWADSFQLRLTEKAQALDIYLKALRTTGTAAAVTIIKKLDAELTATRGDIARFTQLGTDDVDFATTVNALTERKDKLTSSYAIADEIHAIARDLDDDGQARQLMVIAADVRTHGFGMAEVHLRINAVQLRNAMRPVDGRGISVSDGMVSSRSLIDRLSSRIASESPWQINFKNLDNESATARRQLMLAAQFLKHIDCDQPIRLLIAECEKPLTLMSALYLAHKLGIADKLDISPLFETSYGLEHGEQVIDQLLTHQPYVDYVRRRGRLAIQTGFSDAGRFIGQIAANMAIERLQIKIAQCLKNRVADKIALLFFNTHGESLGRGGAQSTMADRQNFIMTPFVRARAAEMNVPLYHQSSFQGGDGYRLFGTPALAQSTINGIFAAEIAPVSPAWLGDPFYQQTDFSLDLFLSLKNWHETLFADAAYSDLLDVFSNNLLPKTGSRPTKRVVQAGNERRDPSKMRAIPHNAILQQLGFLANVISGMGSAAYINSEQFLEIYHDSPRLRQCLTHVRKAKSLGSLNTVLAYCRIIDAGFWVNRAYHGKQYKNQRAFRKLGQHLQNDTQATGIRHTVWRLRDDLVDLYRLVDRIGDGSIRITGDDRSTLDLLHAIRIAVIIDSLTLICQTPNLSESNQYSNADILALGLRLDFETAIEIIQSAFTAGYAASAKNSLAEAEDYSQSNTGNYTVIDKQILQPLGANQRIIHTITQMISAHYGAHG